MLKNIYENFESFTSTLNDHPELPENPEFPEHPKLGPEDPLGELQRCRSLFLKNAV